MTAPILDVLALAIVVSVTHGVGSRRSTETGMVMITPLPGITTTKPGSATRPFPGVDAGVFDERGNEVGPGGGGYLVLKRPWPSILRGIFKDPKRYEETYWSKYDKTYFAGDGARIDRDGDFWLLGRVDDVMNVSGHRISTIEVESALVDHPRVAEAAVCGRADELTGQAIVAYVTLKGGDEGSLGTNDGKQCRAGQFTSPNIQSRRFGYECVSRARKHRCYGIGCGR